MRTSRTSKTIAGLLAALMAAFFLAPLAWMLAVAFSRHPDFLLPGVSFAITIDNFRQVVTDPAVPLMEYLRNSLVVSSTAAVITTFIASLAAYGISRFRFPGRALLPLVVLASAMFPQVSIVGYLFTMLTSVGLINTYAGLVMPYIALALPLALWIMLSHLSRLSTDIDDAARVDGATRLQTFMRIVMPVALPGAASAFLLTFIFCFNEFLFALMFTIDDRARTIPVGIALFEGLHGQIPWGTVMAGAVMAILPVAALIALFERYLIGGLTEGSLKG